MFDVYKPSGGIGVKTYPLILVGIPLAIALAFVYQLLLEWIPLIYISFLITIGMGTGLAMIGSFIVNKGHVRNVMFAGLIGLILATCGLGAKYWFQYRTLLDAATTQLIQENKLPETGRAEIKKQVSTTLTFAKHIEFRTETGWSIGRGGGGAPVKGPFVYLVWLIEAGMIYYFAVKLPIGAAGQPYSEKMSMWADESNAVMTLPITDGEMVSKIKSASSVEQLLEIPIPKTDASNQFAVYTVNSIPGEELEDAYLSVNLITLSVNAKGEQETKDDPLVKLAILSTEKRKQLIENAELLQEAMADFRASLEEEKEVAADADVEQADETQ